MAMQSGKKGEGGVRWGRTVGLYCGNIGCFSNVT